MLRRNLWRGSMVLLGIVFLTSCNLPFSAKVNTTTITSVAIKPAVGEKEFTLDLAYSYFCENPRRNDSIRCSYTTPGGSSFLIDVVDPPYDPTCDPGHGVEKTDAKIIPFSVQAVNGQIESGLYSVVCFTLARDNEKSTSFAVVASGETADTATNTPEILATATLTNTPTPEPQPVYGIIKFNYDGIQSARVSGGGELNRLTGQCVPEVTISPSGEIIGQCTFSGQSNFLTYAELTSTVDGTVDSGGTITFTYKALETGPNFGTVGSEPSHDVPWAVWEVTYSGTGNFSSTAQASGTANFDYSCNSNYEYDFWCNDMTQESFSGTIPWTFTVNP